MDANKRERLVEVGYEIHPVCGMCHYGEFPSNTDWGVCLLAEHDYAHLKHTDERRHMSINRCGGCPKFKADSITVVQLRGFAEFADF